jgi:hypothetical protein
MLIARTTIGAPIVTLIWTMTNRSLSGLAADFEHRLGRRIPTQYRKRVHPVHHHDQGDDLGPAVKIANGYMVRT